MLTYDRKLFETGIEAIQPTKGFEPFVGFVKGICPNISSWIFGFIS